jgi:predicted dehydrogenase
VKSCVIGAGFIAKQHLACLARLSGVEVAGVCDLSPATAEATAERFGVLRWFTDHREMLSALTPDVVHVATPFSSHFALAMDSLAAGAHVFVEKPITPDYGQLQTLIARAKDAGRHVIEDHNYLFNEPVQKIAKLAASGELGRVVHVEVTICADLLAPGGRMADANAPHPALSSPGGASMEYLTHMAYLAHAFVGAHASVRTHWPVCGPADAPTPGGELRALIVAERGTASLLFSGTAQPDVFSLRVHGTRARAEAGMYDPRLIVERLRGGPRPLMPVINGLSEARGAARGAVGGLWRKLAGHPGAYEGLEELLRRTYAALRENRESPVGVRQIDEVNRLVADLLDHRNRSGG